MNNLITTRSLQFNQLLSEKIELNKQYNPELLLIKDLGLIDSNKNEYSFFISNNINDKDLIDINNNKKFNLKNSKTKKALTFKLIEKVLFGDKLFNNFNNSNHSNLNKKFDIKLELFSSFPRSHKLSLFFNSIKNISDKINIIEISGLPLSGKTLLIKLLLIYNYYLPLEKFLLQKKISYNEIPMIEIVDVKNNFTYESLSNICQSKLNFPFVKKEIFNNTTKVYNKIRNENQLIEYLSVLNNNNKTGLLIIDSLCFFNNNFKYSNKKNNNSVIQHINNNISLLKSKKVLIIYTMGINYKTINNFKKLPSEIYSKYSELPAQITSNFTDQVKNLNKNCYKKIKLQGESYIPITLIPFVDLKIELVEVLKPNFLIKNYDWSALKFIKIEIDIKSKQISNIVFTDKNKEILLNNFYEEKSL